MMVGVDGIVFVECGVFGFWIVYDVGWIDFKGVVCVDVYGCVEVVEFLVGGDGKWFLCGVVEVGLVEVVWVLVGMWYLVEVLGVFVVE